MKPEGESPETLAGGNRKKGRGLEGPLPQVPVIAGTLVLVQELWIPSYYNYSTISILDD